MKAPQRKAGVFLSGVLTFAGCASGAVGPGLPNQPNRPSQSSPTKVAAEGRSSASPPPAVSSDATRIMALSTAQCHEQLRRHDVAFMAVPAGKVPQVDQPIRLRGPLAGVTYEIPWSRNEATDPHAIWDCRLAVAMLPLSQWLYERGVRKVRYFSSLRRGAAAKRRPRSAHNVGLAIDILGFAGRQMAFDVEQHYPRDTLRRCPRGFDARGVEALYMDFVCFAASYGLVHTLLTPDYDRAHHNHLHLDLQAGKRAPADPFVSFAGDRRTASK